MRSSSNPNPHSPAGPKVGTKEAQAAVSRRAREIYEKGGKLAGRDLENWMQAEAEIVRELSRLSDRRLALVVRVDGVQYVGEYNLASANGYAPGEFASGDPVPVRFVGNKMLVERPNGKVLETIIAKKVGGTSPPTCTALRPDLDREREAAKELRPHLPVDTARPWPGPTSPADTTLQRLQPTPCFCCGPRPSSIPAPSGRW